MPHAAARRTPPALWLVAALGLGLTGCRTTAFIVLPGGEELELTEANTTNELRAGAFPKVHVEAAEDLDDESRAAACSVHKWFACGQLRKLLMESGVEVTDAPGVDTVNISVKTEAGDISLGTIVDTVTYRASMGGRLVADHSVRVGSRAGSAPTVDKLTDAFASARRAAGLSFLRVLLAAPPARARAPVAAAAGPRNRTENTAQRATPPTRTSTPLSPMERARRYATWEASCRGANLSGTLITSASARTEAFDGALHREAYTIDRVEVRRVAPPSTPAQPMGAREFSNQGVGEFEATVVLAGRPTTLRAAATVFADRYLVRFKLKPSSPNVTKEGVLSLTLNPPAESERSRLTLELPPTDDGDTREIEAELNCD